MFVFFVFFLFILGLFAGGFLNIFVYQIPKKESLIAYSPCCAECGYLQQVHEDSPLKSFLTLKGTCRYCSSTMFFEYPYLELLMGLLFAAFLIKFEWTLKTPMVLFFISILVISAVIDLRHKLIPNRIVLPALGIALLLLFIDFLLHIGSFPLVGTSSSVFNSLIGFVLGGGIMLIPALIKSEWMGGGDVKLAAFMGLFLGTNVILALFLGSLVAAITGIILFYTGKSNRKDPIPFGPFLVLGALVTLFFGP